MKPTFIVELSSCGAVLACTTDGEYLSGDMLQDMLDCTGPGDAEPSIRYVLETYDIDFRTVKNIDGEYQNVTASPDDKKIVCEYIYFESETDFTSEENCNLYLIWEAASQVQNDVQYLLGNQE